MGDRIIGPMHHREPFNDWLARNARGEGLTGLGIGFADKTWLCASWSASLEIPAMETAMRCLADTFDVAGLHRIPALEQKWTFEKTRIVCARRPDKTFIAIFAVNSDEADPARIRQLVEEFMAFQPGTETGPGQ